MRVGLDQLDVEMSSEDAIRRNALGVVAVRKPTVVCQLTPVRFVD